MVMDGNQTYCGDHFAVYTNIKLLCCTPETNIMIHVNYTSILKNQLAEQKVLPPKLKETPRNSSKISIIWGQKPLNLFNNS